MIRFCQLALAALVSWSLAGCGKPPAAPAAAPAAEAALPRELLRRIVERYWDESAASSPWYSWGGAETRFGQASTDAIAPQSLADALALEQRALADLRDVSRGSLDADSRLTYEIFRRERTLAIESFIYPVELMPVNPYEGVPQRFALMAAAAERYALSSGKDFANWQLRVDSYAVWTDQAIANMRDGARRGYTLPRAVVGRTLPFLAALGEDAPVNVFYRALASGAAITADAERARLTVAVRAAIQDKILPAYRKLHDFLRREYLPLAREDLGMSALPLGEAWYGYLVKRATDGTRTPADLNSLGLAEVERLQTRIRSLLSETAFAGNAPGFVLDMQHDPKISYESADALLAAYKDLKAPVAGALAAEFSGGPHADFEIRAVEPFRQATAPALFYRQSMAYGKIPAVLYVNTGDIPSRPVPMTVSGYLREAVPGRHYQLAHQQERADLPRFRRFGGDPAFTEGWGSYAASLGEELGIYRDAQARFGALEAQLDCAARMVTDTGLHALKWTRQRAIDYLRAQEPLDAAAAANEVDRELAMPGEALSCTVGSLEIQALRARAQQALGAKFDLQAFHAEVLRNGAMPLDLLDADIKAWVETRAKLD